MTRICLDAGAELILWLQQFSPALDWPFRALTMIGEEFFFLLMIPFVYWCLDKRAGARLAILFLLSTYANVSLKALAAQPRPFDYDPRVRRLFPAQGGGFPSGHTQNAVTVWGFLALRFRRPWLWALALALVVLVPLSRMYLGAHFPTDLLGGYLIGAALLALFIALEPRVSAWFAAMPAGSQAASALAAAVLFVLFAPTSDPHAFDAAGALAGMGAGFAFERRFVRFDAAGPRRQKALRLALGVAVLAVLFAVFRWAPLPGRTTPLFRALSYAVLGLWGSVAAPFVFVRLGLAQRENQT